jgi:hypothetical protein
VVTCTFSFTGKADSLLVPAGVTQVTIDAKGAQGGNGDVFGGNGASVNANFPVTPTETLNVVVGGMGSTINQGGGGGGGSFVYTSATATGLLIAAAGGGGARASGAGTAGSATTKASDGQTGTEPGNKGGAAGTGGNGGAGGTAGSGFPSTGAGGGGLLTDGGDGSGLHPAIGGNALVNGARGGNGQNSGVGAGTGGFGGGGGASLGGGGGGGYNGGGGGAGGLVGGGGGGSFVASSATSSTGASGTNTGNGQVTITYLTPTCPAGQTPYRLKAVTNVGTIRGLFCVDPSTGIGTYGQFPVGKHGFVSGTGEVNSLADVTDIAASGNDLKLIGSKVGVGPNFFNESSPVNATGTFTLR